jgi:hypothetical protein
VGLPLVVALVAMILVAGWGQARAGRALIGWTLAVSAGFAAGYIALQGVPEWSGEAHERLTTMVLPAGVLAALALLLPPGARGLAGLVGVLVAVGVPAVLLLPYLPVGASARAAGWPGWEAVVWLASLALAVGLVWRGGVVLSRRGPGRSLPVGLMLVTGGAAGVFFLSNSVIVGQLGLVLTAAMLGGFLGSLRLLPERGGLGAATLPWLLLAGLMLTNRFFADFEVDAAGEVKYLLLAAAPLLGWAGEEPVFRNWPGWGRGLVRIVAMALPVGLALLIAALRFAAAYESGAGGYG